MESVLTILLAGGRGTRLDPLTRERAKPAVPFCAAYRIVDFALSNCLNSRQLRIIVLPQYKSLSLERHISQGRRGSFTPSLATGWISHHRNSELTKIGIWVQPTRYIRTSIRSRSLELMFCSSWRPTMCTKWTIAGCLPSTTITLGWQPSQLCGYPLSAASHQFGIVQVDGSSRVMGFQEKPELPIPVPDDPGHCLVSMGIYVFKTRFLVQELRRKATDIEPGHDFGTHVFPRIIGQERVYAFNFTGLGTGGSAYWRMWEQSTPITKQTWTSSSAIRLWMSMRRPGQSIASNPVSLLPK